MSLGRFNETIYTSDGETARPAPEAVATIYLAGTSTEASLYTTIAGTVAAANPASADDDGVIDVYIAPGLYDIDVSTAAGTDTRTNVMIDGFGRTIDAAGTTYTATHANTGDIIQFDSTGSATLALPSAPPLNTIIYSTNLGGGDVVFDPPTGAAMLNGTTCASQKMAAARYVAAGEWQLVGDVT